MALVKCTECGHEVSDKASACPYCGCPIEKNNEELSDTMVEDEPKFRKPWFWVLAAMLLCLIVGGLFLILNNSKGGENETTANEKAQVDSEPEKEEGEYKIVLYNDNEGEFYNPEGGRMCSFTLIGSRTEPIHMKLSQPLTILGESTDRLYLTNIRLFVDYSHYLKYNSSYQPDKTLGVPVIKQGEDDALVYYVKFEKGQIEETHIPTHQFNFNKGAVFTMVYYNDEHGAMFDAKGKRLCGVTKGYSSAGDLHAELAKSISFFGNTTKEIHINGDNVYLSSSDLIHDKYLSQGETSPKVASVKSEDDKDATIYSFYKASEHSNSGQAKSSSKNRSSEWRITSVEQLRKKIVGTVWTCRPTGGQWFRLVFTNSDMTLYYAMPSSGKWLGGSKDDKWSWEATQGYTSDTGEKCYSIQIRKPNDDDRLSYGALIFFNDGEIQFNWLRGRHGGKAECKDFIWER